MRRIIGAFVVLVAAALVGGCASAPRVPAELTVAGPVVGRVHATGYQVYTWQKDGEKAAWKLKAPDATFSGDLSGKHYAGPTWEASDGSKVVGTKVAENAVSGDAVPWLVLKAKEHGGSGRLADVTYIQRLNTTGGKAPAAGGASVGEESRVAYTADYVFFGPGATFPPPK